MRILKNSVILLWRIWFYVLMGLPIILLFPLLLLFTWKEKFYPQFFVVARFWARIIIYGMGFRPSIEREEKPQKDQSYMFVANHTSMMDIMMMLHAVKNPFVFVGKKELAKVPLFGFFYKRTCILVDRKSMHSRKDVFNQAQRRLSQGVSICIFPEGGVPDDETVALDPFKDGAFRLAIEHQIPIVPLVFYDNKKRFSYTFFSGSLGRMRAKILPFFSPQDYTQGNKAKLKQEVREAILTELEGESI